MTVELTYWRKDFTFYDCNQFIFPKRPEVNINKNDRTASSCVNIIYKAVMSPNEYLEVMTLKPTVWVLIKLKVKESKNNLRPEVHGNNCN